MKSQEEIQEEIQGSNQGSKGIQSAIRNVYTDAGRSDTIGGMVLDRRKFKAVVDQLSQVNAWKSLWAIAVQWITIVAAAGLAIWSGHWALYIVAMIVIATRQHAFGVLMHDACHYRLFPNKTVNDMLTDWLVCFHLGASTSLYRKWHFPHHRYVNTDKDPEVMGEKGDPDTWQWPNTKRHMLWVFTKDLLGLNIVKMAGIMGIWSPWSRLFVPSNDPGGIPLRQKISLLIFTTTGLSFLLYFGLLVDYLLLWILPSLTLFNIIFKYRSFAEHKVVKDEHELNNTRTVLPSLVEKFFLAPLNVNFHLEHHLFPSIPFYNLRKMHRVLMKDPKFYEEAEIAFGYLHGEEAVLHELTTTQKDGSKTFVKQTLP